MDMKLRGMYIARQLSFHGVTFKIEEVPLSESFRKSYDDSVELVSDITSALCEKISFVLCVVKLLQYKYNLISSDPVGGSDAKVYGSG